MAESISCATGWAGQRSATEPSKHSRCDIAAPHVGSANPSLTGKTTVTGPGQAFSISHRARRGGWAT